MGAKANRNDPTKTKSHAPAIPGATQEREEASRDEPTRGRLRKVLAINAANTAGGRSWIHPQYQFDGSGQPFDEIAQVIEAFGDADPIAVCDWFAEPNPLLDNHPPMKLWLTDRARVVQAARRMRPVAVKVNFSGPSGAEPVHLERLGSFLGDWEAEHADLGTGAGYK
jgi:hypothetical protein